MQTESAKRKKSGSVALAQAERPCYDVDMKKQNILAVLLAKERWKKTKKADRQAHARMMARARWDRKKKDAVDSVGINAA